MDYMKEWNFLVDEHNRNVNEAEDKIQTLWESYLSHPFQFGYDEAGDMIAKSSLHIGSKNREVPDIILSKNNVPICVIELKRYSLLKNSDFETQLLTYLTHPELHLSVGVLVCEKLYLYWYDHSLNKTEYLEIPFEHNNENGEKFVELFCKENFDSEKMLNFIQLENKSQKNIEAIKNEISEDLICKLLEEYLSEKYPNDDVKYVLSNLKLDLFSEPKNQIEIQSEIKKTSLNFNQPIVADGKTTVTINGIVLPIYRNSNQKVQDFVKQTLETLFSNNLLPVDEIKRLQNKEYCDQTFNIKFPLLESDSRKITISGHTRYWTNFRVSGFYVCSQWWKQLFDTYDKRLADWLRKLEKEYDI